jgi:tRNA(fMet)-specific endonuclease VapC
LTAPKYMLDTNVISDMVKHPKGQAAQRARASQDELCTSIIVACELRYGCAKKGSRELLRKVEEVLDEIGVIPFEVPADTDYGGIRSALEIAGQPIGANDLLIAAHACSMNLTLVTANLGEFSRVRGLKLENWIG